MVQSWPVPSSVKEVQSFLGLASYYRRSVQKFSEVAASLTRLLQKTVAWEWTTEQQRAFETLKQALSSTPVLVYPDMTKQFTLTADASDLAVGAVLQQDHGEGLQPVAYFSRKLKGPELNWTTSEKETLAQVLAFKHWRCFLEGLPFVMQTDHSPLTYLQTQPSLSRKQARWLEYFSQFQFSIQYVKGQDNNVADALSRVQVSLFFFFFFAELMNSS